MDITAEILKAIDYSDDEEYQTAIDICSDIIEYDFSYDRAYFERAMAYLEIGKDNLAVIDFEKLIALNPTYPGGKDWYSRTLSRLGDFRSSATMKFSELRENPEGKYGMGISPQSWAECAENYYKAGDIDTAEEVLTEYFDKHLAKVDKYVRYETTPRRVLIKILLHKRRFEQALNESNQVMKSQYKVPADYELFIESLIANGQTQTAVQEIDFYVKNIQGGYENGTITRLKKIMKK